MGKYDATTKDRKCVFCEIVSGNIPAAKFWEDDRFMAFLSIDPNTEGFTCVIPKQHFGNDVLKMPDAELQRFICAAKTVARILEAHFSEVGRVAVLMEGMGIDHAHIKLAPLHGTGDLKKGVWRQFLSGKEFWFDTYEGWICSGGGPMADPEKLKRLAEALIQTRERLIEGSSLQRGKRDKNPPKKHGKSTL